MRNLSQSKENCEGLLIAHSRVSPSARELASKMSNIHVVTITDYIQSVVSGYYEYLTRQIEASGLIETYVELGFEKPSFSSEGIEVARDSYSSVTAYMDAWCAEPSGTNLVLLGDYGTGKTWITLRYAHLQFQAFWRNPIGKRLPIYIYPYAGLTLTKVR